MRYEYAMTSDPGENRGVHVGGDNRGAVVTGNANTVEVHHTSTGLSRRQRLAVWAAVAAGLLASVVVIVVVVVEDQPAVKVGAYTVTVRGSAVGGARFEHQGELRIHPSADSLPYRWCLKAGFPWAAAAGAIWFGSHDTCFGSDEAAPLVTISEAGGETTIVPAARRGTMNAFTAVAGLTAQVYLPDSGSVRFRAGEAQLEGTIGLGGPAGDGASARSQYTATFSAVRVSDDPHAAISSPQEPVAVSALPASSLAGDRYAIKTVLAFTQVSGNASWIDPARARFSGAVLVVNTAEGRFVYHAPDARSDLFPVNGTATGAGPVFVLAGQRQSGGTTATVGGTLDLSGAEPTVRLTLSTGPASYETTAILRRV
jgi:hypothetical protein